MPPMPLSLVLMFVLLCRQLNWLSRKPSDKTVFIIYNAIEEIKSAMEGMLELWCGRKDTG
jgi:hypothetical protein